MAGTTPHGAHVIAAVSGGSDSMALLELLAMAADGGNLGVSVAHVDHGQRSGSAAEADVVRRRADFHRLEFIGVAIEDPSRNSEAELRRQRYAVLETLAVERGADRIATGHTADDQIETVLMRLLRGAGGLGMSGIPSARGRIVRPLLAERREALKDFLRERRVEWIDDPSNVEPNYARNRMRLHVVPAIGEHFGIDALRRLPKMAARWRAEESFLEAEAARYLNYAVRPGGDGESFLDLAAFDATPDALKGRVLKRWAEAAVAGGTTLALAQLEALEDLVADRDGTRGRDIAGARFTREYGRLRVETADLIAPSPYRFAVAMTPGERWRAPDGSWEVRVTAGGAGHGAGEAVPVRKRYARFERRVFDLDRLPAKLVLRSVRAGDTIRDFAHRSVKVHAMMTDRRVPLEARASWPVLAAVGDSPERTGGQVSEGNPEEILWVPGLASRDCIAANHLSSRTVEVRWNRDANRVLADCVRP